MGASNYGSNYSSSSNSSEGERRSSERDGEGMSVGLPAIRVGFPFYEEVLLAAERKQRRSGEKRRMFRGSRGVR